MKKLSLIILLLSNMVYAQSGIPTIDLSAIAQMKTQLEEAQKRLIELKNQVKAVTGYKGFGETIALTQDIVNSFDNLLKNDISHLTSKSKELFGKEINCESGNDLCKVSSLVNVSNLDYLEKLGNQISQKMDTINNLSQKIKETQDIKSINELQATIALEMNSIALLQQQSDAFIQLNETKSKIYQKQKFNEYSKKQWENLEKSDNNLNKNYSKFLNK